MSLKGERKTGRDLFRLWIKTQLPNRSWQEKIRVTAKGTKITIAMLEKYLAGKTKLSEKQAIRIAQFTGIDFNDL
jgi:hypothetical protein